MTEVPLNDLRMQLASIRPEIDAAVAGVVDSQQLIGGPEISGFESEFATATGSEFAIGVANGTAALSLALEAAGIGSGDEVIVPSMTFAATAEAVVHVGAEPVFADVDRASALLTADTVHAVLTDRTRAVIPVHLHGGVCDMDAIGQLAGTHGLVIVEDSAQAHLATFEGRPVGSFGAAATYSFYPGKNLGAFGDAGAVTTSDPGIAEQIRRLRNHGRSEKYLHTAIGYNHRMDAIQAAVLRVKLRHLPEWTTRRRSIAARYDEAFDTTAIRPIVALDGAEPVHYVYAVTVNDRDRFMDRMKQRGISTAIHYPIPLHLQPAFSAFARSDDSHPASEELADSLVSLPIYPEMTDDQVTRVTEAAAY